MHERVERTVLPHQVVEALLHANGIVEEVDLYGRCGGAGRFDGGDRGVRRRVAIGNRNAVETVVRQGRSDPGREARRRPGYKGTPSFD
jgi:hypothetical protein